MDRKKVIETIFNYPDAYLKTQKKSLETIIDDLKLPEEDYKRIIADSNYERTQEVGKEILKTLVPTLSVAIETLNWNKDVDKDLKEAKRALLLTNYINKVDLHEKAIKDLIAAMGSMYGNTLVNKIFQMLDDFPPDGDLMNHLVSSLKKICESKNYEELFQDHNFFLGTIEKLSPQSITMLTNKEDWPEFHFQFTGMSIGNEIPDQFQKPFIETYFEKKGIANTVTKQRGVYVIDELRQLGFIKCVAVNQTTHVLQLTELGNELYEYLK